VRRRNKGGGILIGREASLKRRVIGKEVTRVRGRSLSSSFRESLFFLKGGVLRRRWDSPRRRKKKTTGKRGDYYSRPPVGIACFFAEEKGKKRLRGKPGWGAEEKETGRAKAS